MLTADMMAYTMTGLETQAGPKVQDVFVIFLHALNSGLFRVKLVGPTGRSEYTRLGFYL